jgi:hypothetical protein
MVSAIDDDKLRAHSIQGAFSPHFAPLEAAPVPCGLSPLSSMTKAGEVEAKPQHRPQLSPPNVMLRVFQFQQKMESSMSRSASLFEQDSKKLEEEVAALEKERREAFAKEIESAKSRDTWSTLGTIAQYTASAASFALGVASGNMVLVAAAFVGGGIQLYKDAKLVEPTINYLWPKESADEQRKIQNDLEAYALFLQTGCAVATGYGAWQAAASGATVITSAQSISQALSTGSGVFSAGTQVGTAFHKKRFAEANARRAEIGADMTTADLAKSEDAKAVGEMLENSNEINKAIQEGIRLQEVEMG